MELALFCEISYFMLCVDYLSPDKIAFWKTIFFISHLKHMLWVLKRTVSMRRFF